MTRLVLLLSLAFAGCRGASNDERGVPDAPCTGCTLDAPAQRDGAVPLLVVLHGDGENAEAAANRWRGPAVERGWAVLSLRCPTSEGCDEGKWYRWNGHPRWVVAQVSAVQRAMKIDPARIFLAGWSGGASYIGMNAHRWPALFAAVVYHGGGQPPLTTRECPARSIPGYFLVGDKNWAHAAQVRLRSYYERCDQPHTWELIEGADHAAEDKALTPRKAGKLLEWLERHADSDVLSAR